MRNVSKEIFLNALVCPTLGWLMRAEQTAEEIIERTPSLAERFRMEQGIEIGIRSRELYPDGILVRGMDLSSALEKTRSLMNDSNISVIFEGTFLIDGFATKADILKRKGSGWYLIEVKSDMNDKEEFIDDMAYTAMVIYRSGFNISNASLLLISRDFRLGMENEELFVEIDHTGEVLDRIEVFKPFWEPIEKITEESVKPEAELLFECRKCELFQECLGRDIENHIFDIPRLTQSKFDRLVELDVVCIEDIADGFPLTENQARVKNCVQTKTPFVGDGLKGELGSISWPAYYLDFETVMTAIPLYPNIAPYTQLPTQYSIHKCSDIGLVSDHREYLADPSKDCRKELAENLINDIKGEGSIIIYSGFEKRVIKSLGELYSDLAKELNSLTDRMIDLQAIISRNFYHHDLHGSNSLKVTLPVLLPDMSYDDLEIIEGDSASAAFAYLALGKYKAGEAEKVKRNLLEYCERDTLAIVKLHQRLVEYV